MKQKTDTLHLVLIGKWYDMIVSSKKNEEYREIKPYWLNRFLRFDYSAFSMVLKPNMRGVKRIPMIFRKVVFHRGYTNITAAFKVDWVSVGMGKTEWGAPADRDVFIIKIGDKL